MREIDTVLFDLDGTLLPMDNDAFTKGISSCWLRHDAAWL